MPEDSVVNDALVPPLLDRDRIPEPLDRIWVLRMPPRSEGLPAGKIKKSVRF